MFKIEIPEINHQKVAEFCATHTDESLTTGISSKVFGGARSVTCTEVTDTLGHYLVHEVCKASSQKLHFAYSFAWVYPEGSFVAPHIDRSSLEWYCGLTMEQDAPWCYQTQYGKNWFSMETGIGKGIVMDGSRYVHRRPVYRGKRAISVVCSYVQNPEDVEKVRNDLQFDHYDESEYLRVAEKIGLNPSDFLGFGEISTEPQQVIELPVNSDELDKYCEAMRSEVYWRHSTDKEAPVLHGQIFTPLMGLHMQLKDIMKERFGASFTTPQPTGIMYQSGENGYAYHAHPNDDWLIVFPLDRPSSENWKAMSGDGNPVQCPYGKALLFRGYPTAISHCLDGGYPYGNWAIMPFRQYEDGEENVYVV